jgi:hypothetical protein
MDVGTICINIYVSFAIYRINGLQSVREMLDIHTL